MALGRLQAALTSATSEVTIAAANLNFDFTLVKYEAPKEYQLLGGVLSTKRKENAEHGSSHILARQLGALFKDVCPATPRLLEAYGKRVSEIAKASKTASDTYTDTLFGDYTGIDGTSIWAAATSSESALYVHLLATLLARIWTAPEATAVWVELVSERRKDIARRVDEGEPVNFSLAAAVGQEIHRSQLAAWDASARSWLRTADGVFKHKQKQLELILKNVNHAVSDDSRVFSSVIKTWQTAVETMNKLISGMPQAVENSASLLGLAAWHIYPDMSVFSPEVVEVKMDDSLVATGGFLSIGLATRPRTSNEKNGVYWSLSLAQLRFYGKPVKVERALETGTRITFSQLDLVIFGVMLAEWRTSDSQGQLVAEVIISLVDYVTSVPQGSSDDKRLLKMLRDSATAYSGRSTGDESLNSKLIQLGRRRAEGFIHDEGGVLSKHGSSSFLFNMLDPVQFTSAFKDSDGQISFLRHLASSSEISKMPPDASIIRYAPFSLRHTHPDQDARVTTDAVTATTPLVGSLRNSYVDTDSNGDVGRDATSVSVLDDEVDMEDLEQEESPLANFPRDSYFDTDSDDESDLDAASASSSDNGVFMEIIGHPNFRPSDFSYATAVPTPVGRGLGSDVLTHHRWLSGHFHDHVLPVENKTYDAEDKFRSWPEEIQITAAENPGKYVYHLAIGDPMQAALFLRRQEFEQSWDDTLTLHHLLWCIEHDLLHPAALLKVLCHSYHAKKDQLLKTLKALSVVAKLYDNLPDTLVDVGVLDRTLTERRWARDMLDDTGRERAATHRTYFSMISYFESGIHDVDPSQLENVIALSSADSLFVCRPVSCLALGLQSLAYIGSYSKIRTS
jgi:hypothetical protein